MIAVNRDTDIGYLVALNGAILPIRPIQVDKDIQKNGIKYRKGEILYIHDQIVRYYILKGFIKKANIYYKNHHFAYSVVLVILELQL